MSNPEKINLLATVRALHDHIMAPIAKRPKPETPPLTTERIAAILRRK